MKPLLIYSLMFMSSLASAQTPKEFAFLGEKSWAAFECSSLSSMMKNRYEQDRLFAIAYEAGKKYIIAAKSGKLNIEEMNSDIYSDFAAAMSGPSIDFMLGRVYEVATREATKNIFAAPNGSLHSEKLIKTFALANYVQKDCKNLH